VERVAEIVGALGIPHNPFTALAIARGEESVEESRQLYATLAEHLRAMAPDTLIIFTTDHYNLFFELSVPIFAIGVAESSTGPSDYPMLPRYADVAIDAELAGELQGALVAAGFDVGRSQEFALDHTILAPLGVMVPQMDVALVPFWISSSMQPIPSAARCHALGAALARALRASALERRVVVAASGAFSFEVGGPRMSETSHVGVPAPEWAMRVTELLAAGDVASVVAETTPQQLEAAGNAAGEILDWIAMLGAVEERPATWIAAQRDEGHAYAAWRL
jgi:aromatic ring-opening dioxygenase catalytic subunit (LigB family)